MLKFLLHANVGVATYPGAVPAENHFLSVAEQLCDIPNSNARLLKEDAGGSGGVSARPSRS